VAEQPKTSAAMFPRTAAIVLARDQASRIAATVRATRSIPGVDLVLVVDDGSTDNTQDLARKAGAVVVRHPHKRGRTNCVETAAAVVAMRDEEAHDPRSLLLLDGGLGSFASAVAPLVTAVQEHAADLAIALVDNAVPTPGLAAGAARRAIAAASGWTPLQPLSRIRCVTREALNAAMPLARGAGLDPAMTLDVLYAGLSVTEVECELRHKPHSAGARAVRNANQYRDVMMALSSRRIRGGIETTQSVVEDTLQAATRVSRGLLDRNEPGADTDR
jgi:hypothetical protein